MSTVTYTEIIFKIKEEYIKHTRVNKDGSIHFILEMPVSEQLCPHCRASTRKSKGKRPEDIKFGATQHHTATVTYLQRRYKCQMPLYCPIPMSLQKNVIIILKC